MARGRKPGNTNDRADAMRADCIRKIADENISHKEWCEYASEQYDITVRRAEMLWSDAWKIIREKFQKDAEDNLVQAVMRLDTLYAEARKSGYDYNSQVNILKEKHRLLGLGKEVQEIKQEVNLKFDFDAE